MVTMVAASSEKGASAAPSMEPVPNSLPRSSRTWLRREETPSTSDSMVSAAPIWSGRTLVHTATSSSKASAAPYSRSAGRSPAGAAATAAGVGAGSAAWSVTSAGTSGLSASPAASSSTSALGLATASSAKTTERSRSTLSTSSAEPAYCGRFMVWPSMLLSVGDAPTPTSTKRSTPRPVSRRSWVSIQRTGEANCQASSSMSRVRARAVSSSAAAAKSSRSAVMYGESTTSAMERTKSSVSSKGRATRFGM